MESTPTFPGPSRPHPNSLTRSRWCPGRCPPPCPRPPSCPPPRPGPSSRAAAAAPSLPPQTASSWQEIQSRSRWVASTKRRPRRFYLQQLDAAPHARETESEFLRVRQSSSLASNRARRRRSRFYTLPPAPSWRPPIGCAAARWTPLIGPDHQAGRRRFEALSDASHVTAPPPRPRSLAGGAHQ